MREAGHESGRAGWRQGRKDAGLEGGRSCPAYLLPFSSLQGGRAGRTLEGVRQGMREARHQEGTAGGRQGRMEAGQEGLGGRAGGRQDRREAGQD